MHLRHTRRLCRPKYKGDHDGDLLYVDDGRELLFADEVKNMNELDAVDV